MSKTKLGLQGNRESGKTYQTVCTNCEWKSGKSTFRSEVRVEGEKHQMTSATPETRSKHKIQMRRVEA